MTAAPHALAPIHAPNAALLIDFDNVTMGIRSDLGRELRSLLSSDIIKGKVAVQRAYADWRRFPQYIVSLTESSIDLIFAPAYGASKKNATDIRLAIDALELVFTRPEIGADSHRDVVEVDEKGSVGRVDRREGVRGGRHGLRTAMNEGALRARWRARVS
jgi:hypothetical protein